MSNTDKQERIAFLRANLKGDIFLDGEALDEIHALEVELGIKTKNTDSPFTCFGCGS